MKTLKSEWLHDDCECGDSLYFTQDKTVADGYILEDTEMTCGDESCHLISQVSFNDDGSTYSTSHAPEPTAAELDVSWPSSGVEG